MLTKDDLTAIEKLLKPIRFSMDAIKADIYKIGTNSRFERMEERSIKDQLGAIQYELEKIKEKLET